MATATAKRLYVAKDAFTGVIRGEYFALNPGSPPVTEDDPRFKAYRDMFREWQPVEQATSAPGERRNR